MALAISVAFVLGVVVTLGYPASPVRRPPDQVEVTAIGLAVPQIPR